MAGLRDKLERLRARMPAHEASEGREIDLDRLRASLGRALGRAAPAASSPPAPPAPFAPVPTPTGILWTHRQEHAPAHVLGTVPLGAALAADATLLSLLSLEPALGGAPPAGALYFDAEATGLGGAAGNVLFLVGLAFHDAERGVFVLEQHLVPAPGEEAPALEAAAARIARASMLVGYNLKSFDLPLLRARAVMNRLPPPPEPPVLDLLHLVRRVHRGRAWRKSLRMAERAVLGYERGADIDGQEVAQRYAQWLRTGDGALLADVAAHNARDVLSLVALTGIYGEPLERLAPVDLAGAALVLRRAGDLERALGAADLAVERGAGAPGLRARAEIAKARGDKRRALADFEAVAREVADGGVRLELCKLYEHWLGEPARALALLEAGGSAEDAPATSRRRARLTRKLEARKRS
jgi:hypothetical protein